MATIDDLFAQNEQILALLSQQGFRRDKVSNEKLRKQIQLILNELRDVKKEIRQRATPGGPNNASDQL